MHEKEHLPVRPDKETVISLVAHVLPDYLEIFTECKKPEAWQKLAQRFRERARQLKIESYVLLYEDERRIPAALLNALMSKEEQADFLSTLNGASPEEQGEILKEFAQPGGTWDRVSDELFPEDPELQRKQVEDFEKLEGEDRTEAIKRGQLLLGFFIAWLHDTLAMMVFGERMTALVPKALAGDREAYARAVQIDKSLIHDHPGFREIHQKALLEHDADFLEKVSYRLAAPVTRGPIRHTAVFMLFAMLETLGWLDGLKHREILDICDAAKIDRWQNRIEDENAVTKSLRRYRRYQKTGGVSMH